MKSKFLQGSKFYTVGSLYFIKENLRQYFIEFHKGGEPIARIYWHIDASQLVLDVAKGITLTKETIIGIVPFLNMDMFRVKRRQAQARVRNEREHQKANK